jgi:hypothetical protein
MTIAPIIALVGVLLFVLFWVWYGGSGKPLTEQEITEGLQALRANNDDAEKIAEVEQLLRKDDGKEFVMQNLVRYRPKALYPPTYAHLGDDPRAADKRYGKAIVWPLVKNGNVMIFIARRSGSFIEPHGADVWHYVAMVRYRSRRDFLRFAVETERSDLFVHKWAAIEKTHVFPVKPLISLVFVRGAVAALLVLVGTLLTLLLS